MPNNETRWLLEVIPPSEGGSWLPVDANFGEDGKPQYLVSFIPYSGYTFTDNPHKAASWKTAEDANMAQYNIPCIDRLRATEHIFTDRD